MSVSTTVSYLRTSCQTLCWGTQWLESTCFMVSCCPRGLQSSLPIVVYVECTKPLKTWKTTKIHLEDLYILSFGFKESIFTRNLCQSQYCVEQWWCVFYYFSNKWDSSKVSINKGTGKKTLESALSIAPQKEGKHGLWRWLIGSIFMFSDETLGTETPRPEGPWSHKKQDYIFSNVTCISSMIDMHTQVIHIFLMCDRRVHSGRKVTVQFHITFQDSLHSKQSPLNFVDLL